MSKQNKILITVVIIIILVVGIGLLLKNNKLEPPNQENGNNNNNYQVKPVTPMSAVDHLWGSLEAPVKLIVYSDFECPFCANYYDTLKQVKEEFGDKVVIAFRHYPLASHTLALTAAEASECAAEQGKFWEMYNELFGDNKANETSLAQFKKDAADSGLEQAKFNQCLATEKYKDKVLAQMLEGKNAGVTGTPTSFVNSQVLVGAYPFKDFTGNDGKPESGMESIINKLLK